MDGATCICTYDKWTLSASRGCTLVSCAEEKEWGNELIVNLAELGNAEVISLLAWKNMKIVNLTFNWRNSKNERFVLVQKVAHFLVSPYINFRSVFTRAFSTRGVLLPTGYKRYEHNNDSIVMTATKKRARFMKERKSHHLHNKEPGSSIASRVRLPFI